MEQPITPNPDPERLHRWARSISAELSKRGVDPSLLMPDELETLMMLRERADAAYGKYLELADAAHKALRQKDYASADYERCLQFMINNLQFNEPVPREKIESHTDDSNGP